MQKANNSISAFLCAFLIAIAIPAHAQNTSAPTQHTSEKSDGRFTAAIGTKDRRKLALANGFINELEIEIQWWGLLGQPVEIYGVRWMPGTEYVLGDGKSLKRASLLNHPDLLARYDDLKPYNIEVSFGVEIFSYSAAEGRSSASAQSSNTGGDYYVLGKALATKTTNNFLIGRSGKMMRDLSPSSPKDWQSFISWPTSDNQVPFIDVGVAKRPIVVDPNTKAQNTFRAAKRITFNDLKIVKIGMPDATALSILSELELRVARKSSAKNEDFWSDDKQAAKNADFWSDDKQPIKTTGSADSGFWGSDEESNEKVAARKSNDFWQEDPAAVKAKITTDQNGHMGVSGANGEILIPYRNWIIDSYQSGIAKVTISKQISRVERKFRCNAGPNTSCLYIPIYDCEYEKSKLLIDKDGNTLGVIEKFIDQSTC